jgi:transglutaminase-like putative cysteine protease
MKKSAFLAAPVRGERDDLSLRRLAQEVGCRVLDEGTMEILGQRWPFASLECGNNERAIRLLNLLAARDATHPRVRSLGEELRAAYPNGAAFLAAVQRFVKVAATFVRETRETFQHTLLTLHRRAGDCDDHAVGAPSLS